MPPPASLLPAFLTLIAVTWLLAVIVMILVRWRPPRLTDYKAMRLLGRLTPADLCYAFETLKFPVLRASQPKPITLTAWLVKSAEPTNRLIVLLHGYADAKVGAAAWLPLLRETGANLLLLDLPAHGNSEGSIATAGLLEADEVRQVIQQMQQASPTLCQSVVLFGISMGASVAAATAMITPTTAVIMDCPFASFARASVLHASLFGLPGRAFQFAATWLAERMVGRSYDSVAPMHLVDQLPCPVLLIEASKDALISRHDADEMRQRVLAKRQKDGRSQVAVFDAPHILALAKQPDQYKAEVLSFLTAIDQRS
jgi:pimeloyl-ACP methyl ester carboxylesterase